MKKEIIGFFICVLLVGTVLPVTGNVLVDKAPLSLTNGNILYVGGSGEGNYTKIQDAIDDALDGDIVYVFDDSSPYYENIIVDKPVFLIGEDKETTIVYGNDIGNVIEIISDGVTLSGFKVINDKTENGNYACIDIYANYTEVSFNIIENSKETGIGVRYSHYYHKYLYYHGNVISNNIIRSNYLAGIYLTQCTYSEITNNIILDNYVGIATYLANDNIISGNEIINNNAEGISIFQSDNNEISGNNITNNKRYGIEIYDARNNKILQNNIMENGWRDAKFVYEITQIKRNEWSNNFWGYSTSIAYLIRGRISLYSGFQGIGIIPWFNIDWNPASEPYDI
jgi:parallel beta-helix repeat protein